MVDCAVFRHFHGALWSQRAARLCDYPESAESTVHLFEADLIIEDHDLHHRTGWKKSYNYGKQTRAWDLLFGTTIPRIECAEHNVDWDRDIGMPLW